LFQIFGVTSAERLESAVRQLTPDPFREAGISVVIGTSMSDSPIMRSLRIAVGRVGSVKQDSVLGTKTGLTSKLLMLCPKSPKTLFNSFDVLEQCRRDEALLLPNNGADWTQ
jgi:hypothetical protein